MRLTLIDTPRKIAQIPKFSHLILRVTAGALRLGRDEQDLVSGGGLPVAVADNIVNLDWDIGAIWMVSDPAGSTSTVEVLVP